MPEKARAQEGATGRKNLALDDPAALAFGARLIQVALERRKRRLATSKGGKRDA